MRKLDNRLVLLQNNSTKGYKQITLSKNNKRSTKKVHRLVAQAFIPNPDNLPDVNHKDENKHNNNVNNLEWCTKEYNFYYGTAIQRRGKKVIQCDLTGKQLKEWESTKEVERQLNIDHAHISKCCKGKQKTAGGFKWIYAERGESLRIK